MQLQAAQLRLQAELQKLALENEGRALDNERRKVELAAAREVAGGNGMQPGSRRARRGEVRR